LITLDVYSTIIDWQRRHAGSSASDDTSFIGFDVYGFRDANTHTHTTI